MRHTQNSALMAEGNPKSPKSPTKELSDSDTSEEEQVNPMLGTFKKERHYRTRCCSALATQIALSLSMAQTNPMVKRGPSCKVRIKKLPKDKAKDKSTQASLSVTCQLMRADHLLCYRDYTYPYLQAHPFMCHKVISKQWIVHQMNPLFNR